MFWRKVYLCTCRVLTCSGGNVHVTCGTCSGGTEVPDQLTTLHMQYQCSTLQKCKGYFNLSVVISVASILLDVHLDCMHDFSLYT